MPVPPELATACADTAEAGPADVIGGRQARYVAAPASTDEASALLRAAARLGLTVVPRGAGGLQHWGNPPDSCDLIVDTRRLDRIIEHRRGDFTVTVQAGVRLPALEEMLEAADQTLPLIAPSRAQAGTIGGVIATNAVGLLRHRYGTPRDRITSITAVRADGTIVRSTDVADAAAGRDLAALFAGSYGTLGLITEATFRVHPLPRGCAGVRINCADPDDAARMVGIVAADSWLAPSGISLSWPSADSSVQVFVMVDHDTQDYQERVDQLWRLAGQTPPPPIDQAQAIHLDAPDHGGLPPAVAQRLLAQQERIEAERLNPPADTGTLVRASFPPPQLAQALTAVQGAAAASGLTIVIDGSPTAGVLDVKVPAEAAAAVVSQFVVTLRTGLDRLAGPAPGAARTVVVYAPEQVREVTDMLGPVPSLAALQSVKDEFDPEHRMAPGRLAEAA
ncbi:MAG TPA: FAD-binding oxidoreductase [Streptosporangiaceae bacterium]|jgi:glycolate oxidase FAD binding subunit